MKVQVKHVSTVRKVLASSLSVILVGGAVWLSGCQNLKSSKSHKVVMIPEGHKVICQLCYDEIQRVKKNTPLGKGVPGYRSVKKHMCPNCKSTSNIFTQNGALMTKCSGCVPEGLACDKCLPPVS